MKQKPISDLEDHLGYWLRCLSNFVSERFEARLAAEGVTVAQWVVLRSLFGRGPLTLNAAAALIGVDSSTLSRMVERLVHKDWVRRVTDPEDRRSVQVSLTPEGARRVPELAALADENDAEFFGTLSDERKLEFLNTIKDLLSKNGWDAVSRGKDRLN